MVSSGTKCFWHRHTFCPLAFQYLALATEKQSLAEMAVLGSTERPWPKNWSLLSERSSIEADTIWRRW